MTPAIHLPPDAAFEAARRAQALAAHPERSAWVGANAGSGKTKVLIDRVARLLLRGASPDAILCVTYTRAAASEMLARLFRQLGDWAVMAPDALRSTLGTLEDRDPVGYTGDDLRKARRLFARALETPGGLRIETIHAFCARILRRFPAEAQIPAGFTELEEDEARTLWQGAINEAIGDADTDPHASAALDTLIRFAGGRGLPEALGVLRPHAATLQAIMARHQNDLNAVCEGLRTQLNAPDADPDTLIAQAMAGLPRADLSTLADALAGYAADQSGPALRESLLALLAAPTPATQWDHLRPIVLTQEGGVRKNFPTKGVRKLTPLAERLFATAAPEGSEVTRVTELAKALRQAALFTRTRALLRFGIPLLQRYAEAKRARAALDFDDLIVATRDLLQQAGASDWVLYKLDGAISHVLLDEAQDTSPIQWQVLRALTAEFFAGQGAERSDLPRTRFVVGDEKQSIYSFQGADADHFLLEQRAFEAECRNAGAAFETPEMAMSFRSVPQVLAFVDAVLDAIPAAATASTGDPASPEPPRAADAPTSRHTARRAALSGCVELRALVPKPDVTEPDPWTAPVDALSAASPALGLANWIATRCKGMIDRREAIWTHTPDGEGFIQRPVNAGDILILVSQRTGGLFNSLIGALKAKGLPVAGADRLTLSDHTAVQDTLNLLRFSLLPADDLVLAELLRSPFLNLVDDDNDLFPLAHARAKGETLWQRLQDAAPTAPRFAQARDFLTGLITRRGLPAFEAITAALNHTFPDGSRARERLIARLGEPARDPLNELLRASLEADGPGPASVRLFLDRFARAETQIKRDLARPDGEIRVMTVHGAKGLEAPIVILADTTRAPKSRTDGLMSEPEAREAFPLLPGKKEDDADTPLKRLRAEAERRARAEHKRLLYVALTRAQDRLIIAGAWAGKGKDGFAADSWYALCKTAMETLYGEPAPDPDEPDGPGITRYGPAPVCLPAAPPSEVTSTTTAPPPPAWLHTPPAATTRATGFLSPSRLTRETGQARPPFAADDSTRYRRGTLIHSLLEILPDRSPDIRPEIARTLLTRAGVSDPAAIAEMTNAALRVLDDPAIASVFAPGSRAEVAVVGRVDDGLGGALRVAGRVDRLAVSPTEILIVDFKTDRPPPASLEALDPAYLVQMAAYRGVLANAWPGRAIVCALLWTEGPRLMILPDDAMTAAFTLSRAQLRTGPDTLSA